MRRLNADGRGELLGEFQGDDKLIVWTARNLYYITNFDLTQHFPDDTVRISRYRSDAVYAVVYFDRAQNYYYLKRFAAERSEKMQPFLDENSDLVAFSERPGSQVRLVFGGAHAARAEESIDADAFIGVKSHRAKGKRLSTYRIAEATFVEPESADEEVPAAVPGADDNGGPEAVPAAEHDDAAVVAGGNEVADETEQLNLF